MDTHLGEVCDGAFADNFVKKVRKAALAEVAELGKGGDGKIVGKRGLHMAANAQDLLGGCGARFVCGEGDPAEKQGKNGKKISARHLVGIGKCEGIFLFEFSPKLFKRFAFPDEENAPFPSLDLPEKLLGKLARKMQIEGRRPHGGGEAVLLPLSGEKEYGVSCRDGDLITAKRHEADALGDVEDVIIPSALGTAGADVLKKMLTATAVEMNIFGGNGFGASFCHLFSLAFSFGIV